MSRPSTSCKRLDGEREEREKLQAKFDEAQASSKKTIGTLEVKSPS